MGLPAGARRWPVRHPLVGHTTLDMVRRHVALADFDLVACHATASPADRLAGGRRR
jgi:hypothetical protein